MDVISAYAVKHSLCVSIPNENDYSYYVQVKIVREKGHVIKMEEDSSPESSYNESLGFALKRYYDMLESEEKLQVKEQSSREMDI